MIGSRGTTVAWIGLAMIVAGMFPALWAAGELGGGVTELPRHWWSALATLPLGIGIVMAAVGLMKLSRTTSTPPSRT